MMFDSDTYTHTAPAFLIKKKKIILEEENQIVMMLVSKSILV